MWLNILRQEDLQTLGALPSLQTLVLHVLEIQTTEERLAIGTGHAKFLCLSKFCFHNNAIGLMFAQVAMPRLEILDILFRVRETKDVYGGFDLGLGNLSSLKQATVKIDCGGSRVCEVEDAAAAMSKAANLNPNHPRLDVIRLHEDDMIEDDGKLQVDEETTKDEEKEEIEFHRVGPWGGDGGKDCDITMAPRRLKSVKILSGDVVDALGFSYWDRRGKQHTTPLWGGVGGSAYTIHMGPSEYVVEVSGTCAPFFAFPNVVTSLTLVTNLCRYGPFGKPQGTTFRTGAKQNSSIVGFFGRSSRIYLDAIGVYIC